MAITVEVEGLNELIEQCQTLATPRELEATDKKAIQQCLDETMPIVREMMRVSEDVRKSGWNGNKTYTHARDSLNKRISKKNGSLVGEILIDDGKSNNPHSYYNFDEFLYGNSKYQPSKPFQRAFIKLRKEWDKIFEDEYNKLLEELGG